MKKSFFVLSCFLLVISLNGRENPFEPTDIYKEKQVDFLKQLELEDQKEQQMQLQLQLHEQAMLQREKELEDLELLRQDELRKIEELKVQRIALEKQKQQMIQTNQQPTPLTDKHNILPFIQIEANDDRLVLYVDTKFKLINQDILKERKKILYDFEGHTSFYTISKNLKSKSFKGFTVGTHKAKGFFRVVIKVNNNTSQYLENIDTKEGRVTLTKR